MGANVLTENMYFVMRTMNSTGWRQHLMLLGCCLLAACNGGGSSSSDSLALADKAALGESLFFDVNLSHDRTQACATCHDPDHAFIDGRLNVEGKVAAASTGDDGISIGDRNAPTAAYAAFGPDFHTGSKTRFNSQQSDYSGFLGGQFVDGRAANLAEQAGGPPLNPLEMNMPDEASVVERLQENADYVAAFKHFYGDEIFDDVDAAYAAMTESIAAFEKTDTFASFDSRYDRFLNGEYPEYILTKAAVGKALFFSQTDTNCATCHQLHANGHKQETFTSYEYHNIGVPENTALRAINGKDESFVDFGLWENSAVTDEAEKGKFKVPTLRNVAVTAPYMHNGVFRELKTVVLFYDHFNNPENTNNPETGEAWADPEVADTVNTTELEDGDIFTDEEVEAMVCFLRSLTDARYEQLIPVDDIDCGW